MNIYIYTYTQYLFQVGHHDSQLRDSIERWIIQFLVVFPNVETKTCAVNGNENHSRGTAGSYQSSYEYPSGEKLAKLVRFGRERLAGDRKLVAPTFPAKYLLSSSLPSISQEKWFLKTSLFWFQIAPIKIPFSIHCWTLHQSPPRPYGGLKIVRRCAGRVYRVQCIPPFPPHFSKKNDL